MGRTGARSRSALPGRTLATRSSGAPLRLSGSRKRPPRFSTRAARLATPRKRRCGRRPSSVAGGYAGSRSVPVVPRDRRGAGERRGVRSRCGSRRTRRPKPRNALDVPSRRRPSRSRRRARSSRCCSRPRARARVEPITAEAQQAIVDRARCAGGVRTSFELEPIPVGDVLTALVTPDGVDDRHGRARRHAPALGSHDRRGDGRRSRGPRPASRKPSIDPNGRWLVAVGEDGAWRWDLDRRDRRTVSSWTGRAGRCGPPRSPGDGSTPRDRRGRRRRPDLRHRHVGARRGPVHRGRRLPERRVHRATGPLARRHGRRPRLRWDPATGELAAGSPIAAHGTNDVWEFVLHPAGDLVATGSSDGTARSGRSPPARWLRPVCRPGRVEGLVWSADGEALYAGGDDGLVHEYRLDDAAMAGLRRSATTTVSSTRRHRETERCS